MGSNGVDAKSCRTCVRRRIRCDFGRPSCAKCIKKGLSCPGYGRQLRWADGVAVRGRLKGQRVPVPRPQNEEGQDSGGILLLQGVGNSLNVILCASLPEFIDYYDKKLAGLMVWIDSEENLYRRRMLPMAAETPGLRFAIAAFSAYHGPMTCPYEMPRFHEAARDACLEIIEHQLQDMNGRLTGGCELNSKSDIATAEWMLACILVIGSYEMAKREAITAEGHKRAARTLVNVFGSNETRNRGLFAFLRNQLSIQDVLTSTTSFDLSDVEQTIVPNSDSVLFSEYLLFLHHVTLLSRQAMATSGTIDPQPGTHSLTAAEIRSRFEQARGHTLMVAGQFRMEPSIVRRDFVRLVDIYHHAAVLYSYRCFGHATLDNSDRTSSILKLFEELEELEDLSFCVQNLPWPVFIAGTECYGDKDKHDRVAKLLTEVIRLTRFRHYEDIETFLNAFWNGTEPDWRPLAQQFQANGIRILLA